MMRPISQLRRETLLRIVKNKDFSYENLLFFQKLDTRHIDESFFLEIEDVFRNWGGNLDDRTISVFSAIFSHPDCPTDLVVAHIDIIDRFRNAHFIRFSSDELRIHSLDEQQILSSIQNMNPQNLTQWMITQLCKRISKAEKETPFSDELINSFIEKIIQSSKELNLYRNGLPSNEQFYPFVHRISNRNLENLFMESPNTMYFFIPFLSKNQINHFVSKILNNQEFNYRLYANPNCPESLTTSFFNAMSNGSKKKISPKEIEIIKNLSCNPALSSERILQLLDLIKKTFELQKNDMSMTPFILETMENLLKHKQNNEKHYIETMELLIQEKTIAPHLIQCIFKNDIQSKKIMDFIIDKAIQYYEENKINLVPFEQIFNSDFLDFEKRKLLIEKIPYARRTDMFRGLAQEHIIELLKTIGFDSIDEFVEQMKNDEDIAKQNYGTLFSLMKYMQLDEHHIESLLDILPAIKEKMSELPWTFLGTNLWHQKAMTFQQRVRLIEAMEEEWASPKIPHQSKILYLYDRIEYLTHDLDTQTQILLLNDSNKPSNEFLQLKKMLVLEQNDLPKLLRKQFDQIESLVEHKNLHRFEK